MDAKPLRDRASLPTSAAPASRLTALRSLAAAATQAQSPSQLLQLAAAVISEALNLDRVRIFLLDPQVAALQLVASVENRLAIVPPPRDQQSMESILGMVAQSGKPAIFENILTDPFYNRFNQATPARRDRHRFFAAFPIGGQGKRHGVLLCANIRPRKLSDGDGDFLEAVADQIAAALAHFDSIQQLEITRRELAGKTDELERRAQAQAQVSSFISGEAEFRLKSMAATIQTLRQQNLGAVTLEHAKALESIASESDHLLATFNTLFRN